MKHLIYFEKDKDAIYDRTNNTMFYAPGVAYIKDSNKVIYAPFALNQKYYIDVNYNAVLYKEYYINITNKSESVEFTDDLKTQSFIINFTYEHILPETITVNVTHSNNMNYLVSDISFNDDNISGSFTLTVSTENYGNDVFDIVLIGKNINNEDILSNNIKYSFVYSAPSSQQTYYLRYSNGNQYDYNQWENEVEGVAQENGDIMFGPIYCEQYNNYVALTTKQNDTLLTTNVNVKPFIISHDNTLYNVNNKDWNGKSLLRLETTVAGYYSVVVNFINKTIDVKAYSLAEQTIKVGTYNIRYYNGQGDTANTGDKSWEYRDEYVFNMIKKHNPDVCGLQEVTPQMTQDIIDNLSEYTYIGYGRVSGNENPKKPLSEYTQYDNDEQTGLIYKTSKFDELKRGKFFLSDTPITPSKYEESDFNRLCAYVQLKDKETGKEFYFFSTHLDHPKDDSNRDEQCRIKQATALVNNIRTFTDATNVFIVGDFNSEKTEEAYPIVANEYNDSYILIGDKAQGGYICNTSQLNQGLPGCSLPGITYTGLYSSTDNNPKRLDYVFTSLNNIDVVSYIADNDTLGATNYPSDHLPVIVEAIIK